MPFTAYQLADFQHGGVHEAKLGFALQQVAQQPVELWQHAVTMGYKVLVGWQSREVRAVVLFGSVVDLTQGLLLHREQIED